jgi:hypothetical protein
MYKRGQITVFVIIAILIVLGILVYFFIRSNTGADNTRGDTEISETNGLYQALQECIELDFDSSLILIGLQGGYITVPENHVKGDINKISYGYYNEENVLNTIPEIGEEINNFLESTANNCIDENEYEDLEIIKGNIKSSATIVDGSVKLDLIFPVKIEKADKKVSLTEAYEYEIDSNLFDLIDTSNKIISNIQENPDTIDLTFMTNLNYDVVILPIDDDTSIYVINDDDYIFQFGVRT